MAHSCMPCRDFLDIFLRAGARASAGAPTRHARVRALQLEVILQSELQYARVTGAGDLSEIRCPHRQPRVAQVRMVQDIEEFRAELQLVPLRYRESLVDGKVPVKWTRTE